MIGAVVGGVVAGWVIWVTQELLSRRSQEEHTRFWWVRKR